jgi:hypothetical protein
MGVFTSLNMLLRALRIILYVVILGALTLWGIYLAPGQAVYQIQETYTFRGAQAGSPLALAALLPVSGPYQVVSSPDVSWSGISHLQEHPQTAVLELLGTADASGAAVARISYQVRLKEGRVSWVGRVQPADLLPGPQVESDAAVLVNTAQSFAGQESAALAMEAYLFSAEHLVWPNGSREGSPASALAAFYSQVGVCTEFANLMTALCRANGVPARSISGLLLPVTLPYLRQSVTWNHPAGSHAWVEMYAGETWTLADPSAASGVTNLPWISGVWFGRSDGKHLSYGETEAHNAVYAQVQVYAEKHGVLLGAMSAPLKFAAAGPQGAAVLPEASLVQTWDSRWAWTGGLYLGSLAVLFVLERNLHGARQKA